MVQSFPKQYRKGDVVLVAFPYTDDDAKQQTKKRPAVIVSGDRYIDRLEDVLLVPLTTTGRRDTKDVSITILFKSDEGQRAGLKLDSIADCSVIATIPKKLLVSKIGSFSPRVMRDIDECIKRCMEMDRS